ncbi:MAG: porin [Myxococcota bacterium]
MNVSRSLALVAAASALCAFEPARAATDSAKPVVERLLDIMLRSGQLSQDQYEELLEQAREEQVATDAALAEAARALENPPVSDGPVDWKFKWSNSFKLDRNDGAFKLKFGGRIQTDSALIWESSDVKNTIGGEGSGVEFRRARLFFEGTVYERLFFKAQYDFANTGDGKTDFKDVYIGLKGLGPVRDVKAGHFKEPMFLEESASSKYITFMERGLNSAFFPGRNVGFMASGNALEKSLQWQLGIFRETNDQGFAFDDWNDADWNLSTRVVGVPYYADEGGKLLHLGASYSHEFRGRATTTRYSERPEAHLARPFAVTAAFPASDVDLLNLEAAGVWGPFSLQSEFTNAWVTGRGGQQDLGFWGLYAFASYFLTGEQRHYEYGKGAFGQIEPRHNFDPGAGHWGALEVAARFSYLDLDDRNIRGGKLWDVTAGLNWYLFPNARIMLNYVHADLDDLNFGAAPVIDVSGTGDIVQMRLQLEF